MRFFNIQYECNDARDDYSKTLKQKNANDGVFPHCSELMTMITLMVITMMMAVTLSS